MLAFLLGGTVVVLAFGGGMALKLTSVHAASSIARRVWAGGRPIQFTYREGDREVELLLTPREIEKLSSAFLDNAVPGVFPKTVPDAQRDMILRKGAARAAARA